MKKPQNIDEFIAQYPPDVQAKLQKIRAVIRKAAPKAEESINYGIACFKLNGKNLIFFSGAKKHIGVYPRPRTPEFVKLLAVYKGGKGTIQFPHDKPIPLGLIVKLVKARIRENLAIPPRK
jgi:uncharacterized protein YdhG (YjbR/CyaY superfamily)